jgi:hypothetical protein
LRESLGPVGYGAGRNRVTLIHNVSVVLGSVVMACVLASFGRALVGNSAIQPLLALAVCLSIAQALAGRWAIQSRWQVPEIWRRTMDPRAMAVGFGVILGFGVFTAVVSNAFWAFLLLSVMVTPAAALTGWLVYSLARSVALSMSRERGDEFRPPTWGSRVIMIVSTGLAIVSAQGVWR